MKANEAPEQYIPKSALVAEIERRRDAALMRQRNLEAIGQETCLNEMIANELNRVLQYTENLEVKEVDIDKMLCFRRNTGFAYPEGASEYQRHLACYRQGIEDVLKAQKGE